MAPRSLPILVAIAALAAPSVTRAAEPAQLEFFESKIRPVLVRHCYDCHSDAAKKAKGGLRLDTRATTRKGGDTGPGVVPGKPAESLVLKALRYHDDLQMPPKERLPESVAKDFEAWITAGAADPRDDLQAGPPAAVKSTIDYAKGRQFWAFQPPARHPVPTNRDPIDSFVRAKLSANGLTPAAPADARTLIRRLTFDLTGLPPTPEESDAFATAFAANPQVATEAATDRLLASPAYGERWARAWLDVARYAEDQAHIVGNNTALTYPNAYLYRDWVIQALNADVPYDRFVRLQLAADLIEGPGSANLAALGFIGLGPKYYSRGTLEVMADEWEDRVDVVGRGLLGLTVACARCHDHKFDPIATADYYALAGVFSSTEMFNRPLTDKVEKTPNGQTKTPEGAMHIVREGTPADLPVFIRGDVNQKGPPAPRRFLPVLAASDPRPFGKGSGRAGLADAVASRDNPLTARVIVNRVWAAYFGRGLVGTPSNFGELGDRPTHPELLDHLAVEFMENGWSLKWLHREIVRSATYQQSSHGDPKSTATDPENRWLGRMPRRRLTVEQWRDAVLAVSGHLDRSTIGGRSLDPLDPKEKRRTVYARVSRLDLNRLLAMFDFPDPNATADRRVETTTPLQKLYVMNGPLLTARASSLATQLRTEVPDDTKRIDRAYRLLYGRPPVAEEKRIGLAFLSAEGDPAARWTRYVHALLAANEMLFLD